MLNKLAVIANELDSKGFHKEADLITAVLKRLAIYGYKCEICGDHGAEEYTAYGDHGLRKGHILVCDKEKCHHKAKSQLASEYGIGFDGDHYPYNFTLLPLPQKSIHHLAY